MSSPAAVLLFPRRKRSDNGVHKTYRRNERSPVIFDLAKIAQSFHSVQSDAAEALGISVTCLKKVCRKLGVKQWPGPTRRPRAEHPSDESDGQELKTVVRSSARGLVAPQSLAEFPRNITKVTMTANTSMSTCHNTVTKNPFSVEEEAHGHSDDMQWLLTIYQDDVEPISGAASESTSPVSQFSQWQP